MSRADNQYEGSLFEYLVCQIHNKDNVKNCDFTLLAEMNTSTPGFGKGDFISLYTNSLRR